MMTRIALAALLAASLTATACGTTTESSGTATDTQTAADVVADTATAEDTAETDAKADTGKDVQKADIQTPGPTWGECAGTDTPCIQQCISGVCTTQQQACGGDKKCIGYQDCIQGCAKTPIVLPPQDATPVAALPNETTVTYCQRVCDIQAGPVATLLFNDFVNCALGTCLDCGKPIQGMTKSQCQQLCGQYSMCETEHDTCFEDTDCLDVLACISSCDQGDAKCQGECQSAAKGESLKEIKALDDCVVANKSKCKAP